MKYRVPNWSPHSQGTGLPPQVDEGITELAKGVSDDRIQEWKETVADATYGTKSEVAGKLDEATADTRYVLKGEASGGGGIFFDTDGVPYFSLFESGGAKIDIDTDGVPYIKIGI